MPEDGRRRKFVETFTNLYIISYFMIFNNTFIRVGHAPQRLKYIPYIQQLSKPETSQGRGPI